MKSHINSTDDAESRVDLDLPIFVRGDTGELTHESDVFLSNLGWQFPHPGDEIAGFDEWSKFGYNRFYVVEKCVFFKDGRVVIVTKVRTGTEADYGLT